MKKLSKTFDRMISNAKKLEQTETIPFTELFNNEFMSLNTNCSSFEDFIEKSEFTINNQEDFNNLNEQELDTYVRQNSKFNSWSEMMSEATSKYISKNLFR